MAHLKQNQMFKLVFHELEIFSSTMWNLTATIMVTSPLLWLPRQQSYIAIKITAEYK